MKPTSHDPLDDLIIAALHGELTPAERARFDSQIANDPAVRTAYQEALLMHDLLEKTHTSAQPDPGFEQRMVSGVRRKITEAKRPPESAWQSVVIIWTTLNNIFGKRAAWQYATACLVVLVGAFSVLLYSGSQVRSVFTTISSQLSAAQSGGYNSYAGQPTVSSGNVVLSGGTLQTKGQLAVTVTDASSAPPPPATPPSGYVWHSKALNSSAAAGEPDAVAQQRQLAKSARQNVAIDALQADESRAKTVVVNGLDKPVQFAGQLAPSSDATAAAPMAKPASTLAYNEPSTTTTPQGGTVRGQGFGLPGTEENQKEKDQQAAATAIDTRKLIRNAQLDLEVKSFQETMDQITALTKAAGGYVDSDNSQRGGNGKIQGAVVVKILPQNLDDFLLKLRDLGELKNQTISTDDVTKEYVDIEARLDNSRRMEAQLQDLLKRDYGKISDLLQVERELGRVRGEIEQMQGQLKLYDFQVAYATVTMQVNEKDLNQAAAYLLKEQDNFTVVSTDVEAAFQQARRAADDFKGQVLTANLNHTSGSDVSAQLDVMVPPDQIEPFLAQIRSIGRVDNFTRQTQRVARDGGDSTQPADQALTEKDKVEVQIAIGSDTESHKQAALTVVTSAVDEALDQAKTAALAQAGTEILSSSLNKAPEGQSTAQLSVRVPGKSYHTLLDAFKALGRTASFSLQRDDNSGPGASGDDEPVVVDLSLTDDETPVQTTQMDVCGADVDSQAQQLKQDAATAGVEIKSSSFQHDPDGTETAQMSFRLPMDKYPAFVETLKKLGKVESLTVNRNDRPDETRADGTAPAQIDLTLHNERDIVADDNGLWATLRGTFSEGAGALFGSVRFIGVAVAFLIPWLIALVIVAWIGRRIYVWYKK
jgi:anti-sigma factor RsiW